MPRRKYSRRRKRRVRRRPRRSVPAAVDLKLPLTAFVDTKSSGTAGQATVHRLGDFPQHDHRAAVVGSNGSIALSALLDGGDDLEAVLAIVTPLQGDSSGNPDDSLLGSFNPFDSAKTDGRKAASAELRGFNVVRFRRISFGIPTGTTKQVIIRNIRMTRRFRRILDADSKALLALWVRSTAGQNVPFSVTVDASIHLRALD